MDIYEVCLKNLNKNHTTLFRRIHSDTPGQIGAQRAAPSGFGRKWCSAPFLRSYVVFCIRTPIYIGVADPCSDIIQELF